MCRCLDAELDVDRRNGFDRHELGQQNRKSAKQLRLTFSAVRFADSNEGKMEVKEGLTAWIGRDKDGEKGFYEDAGVKRLYGYALTVDGEVDSKDRLQ